ncbi:PREDICTED: odorant receptor 94a-like [Ceratosolen solmsi marchali]|uniref:Odorant receptor n=1 Tax=Ceratosolen solmsi marchali TaxID=326594 RepID=A0AAJ6YLG8_9HYME|nr:PREDICTED: odorant receptor 94a-like [Ceratosolen solmsi marchali]
MTFNTRIIQWNKLLMSPLGLWPENFSNLRFYINFLYMGYFVSLEYLDLWVFIEDFDRVLLNVVENAAFTQIMLRMYILYSYNRSIGALFNEINDDLISKEYTNEERKIFITYQVKSVIFIKLLVISTALTATSHYANPFIGQISEIVEYAGSSSENSSIVFRMPYCFYQFYEIKDVSTYFWTYGTQLPFVFVSAFGQCSSDCLMVTMVYHISGQMAVLALRITNIDTDPKRCTIELQKAFRLHIRLLRMGKDVQEIFSVILIGQIISSLLLVCTLGYQILLNLMIGDNFGLSSLIVFIFLVFLILYTHCTIGENLIIESNRVAEAYYNCNWYQMSNENAKMILLCIHRAQKPMQLSAGQFKTFCLMTYTDTIKTSLGYLSVLRKTL